MDDLNYTLVNLSRIRHTLDSFIIATHGRQVFYVTDPVDERWLVVVMPPHKEFPYKCADETCYCTIHQFRNGQQQVILMKWTNHTLDVIVKAHGLPLDFQKYVK